MQKKQNEIYFGEQGLTTTSAEFVANMAKEMLKKDESWLEGISFVCEEFCLVNNPQRTELCVGMEEEEVRSVSEVMERMVKLKSLIAWLKEAIKAKKAMMDEVNDMTNEDFWTQILGKEEPLQFPKSLEPMTKEEYISTMSVAERCKMSALQTKAAAIGKLIHKNGHFAAARERLFNLKSKPREIISKGVNNLVYYYEPSVSIEVVDDVFFKLNKEYREAQAQLNAIIYEIEAAVKKSEIETAQKNSAALEKYYEDCEMRRVKKEEWCLQEHKRISDLKIIIPNALKPIYDEVQKVGK